MERRLILAIALSLLVLLSWSAFVSKTYHIENKVVTQKIPEPTTLRAAHVLPPQISPTPPHSSTLTFSLDKKEFAFIEPAAAIQRVTFKDYQSNQLLLKYGLLWRGEGLDFKKVTLAAERATFIHKDINKQIIKDFIFSNTNYGIELSISIENLSTNTIEMGSPLILGVLDFSGDQNKARFQDVTIGLKEKIVHSNAHKDATFDEIKFLGLRDQYFCAIIEPLTHKYRGFIKKINRESEIGLVLTGAALKPGEKIEEKFRIYLGPQELKHLTSLNPEWSAVMYFGTFDFISHILLQLLEIAYRILHNWGWAIVILSTLIYLALYPLTLKQMRSMKEMQALQPRIEELRRAHKDNPQKLNKAIMALYREHRVNPFGGCLPMILQIPVFFALYQVLSRAIALKGAKFLWIKDLSEPDRLFNLPAKLPIIGDEINILPILMMVGMLIQQKKSMAQAAASKEQAAQQKFMLILFPLMFGFIFYHMPAGLVLYWFINSTLTLIYQLKVSRAKGALCVHETKDKR